MSTTITADNGAEIQVGQLGITVDHPEGIASVWARLSPEQRAKLAAALPAPETTGQWTRDDLPDWEAVRSVLADRGVTYGAVLDVLYAVVEHLNAHHPKPGHPMDPEMARLRSKVQALEGYNAEWRQRCNRREREIADLERDRDAAITLADDLDKRLAKVMFDYQDLEDERDNWKVRAEQAEREVSTWRTSTESAHSDFLQAAHERDEWRESADKWHGEWQKIAPTSTVTRADVEKAIRAEFHNDGLYVKTAVEYGVCRVVCDMFGVEAEQAVNPVEEKAVELYLAAYPEGGRKWERLVNVEKDAFRKMAAHVLGQEADQ